jgi:hypothetical protein
MSELCGKLCGELCDSPAQVIDADAAAVARHDVPDIALGVTRGLAADDYHGERSAVSSTQLERMRVSPAHFLSGLHEPEQSSEAVRFGLVLRARLLEPETFGARFFAIPKLNRSTKEGKQRHAEFMAQAGGRTVFPEAWKEPVERIVDNARAHRKARELLSRGEPEVAIAWIDAETGVKCKVRIDWWHDDHTLVDVKSAEDVTYEGFRKACARYGYALSAAMYCEGVRQLTGEDPEWAFLACEKERPHTVAVYRASRRMLERGRRDLRAALRRLAECRARGHFPALQADGDWEEIDLPAWA